MAKIYKGNVSVVLNTKKEITVKADPEGKFNTDNVVELYETMLAFGKKMKAPVKTFKPDPKGTVPVLMYSYENSPYLALMPALPDSQKPGKVTVIKLA